MLVLWLMGGLLGLGAVLAIVHSDLTLVLAPLGTAVQTMAWVVWLVEAVWRPVLIGLCGALPPDSEHGVVDYGASCRVAAWRCS